MKKYFYIHIPKNGGTSIRRSPYITSVEYASEENQRYPKERQKAINYLKSINEASGCAHSRLIDIKKESLKNKKVFAIVRNPWSRTVSRFLFAKKLIEIEKTWGSDYADISSFENFLEERHKWGNVEYLWYRAIKGWYSQYGHVIEENGQVACDILRFENYQEDIQKYFGLNSNEIIKARNVTNDFTEKGKILQGKTYMEYYTDETKNIIGDWYKDDIDYWGFEFETGAQRNYWNV
jgi:hypothetical protein